MTEILRQTRAGLYCPAGDFHVDPHVGVDRAVVSHAHTDHAHWGCKRYLASTSSEHLLRLRVNPRAQFDFADYGKSISLGGVRISFHPAGHILGSAQVRLEHRGQVVVVTGDYKLGSDATCKTWEPVNCHTMITESTFGLPIYRWPTQDDVAGSINQWWRDNAVAGRTSVIYGYAVGKSQRILSLLDPSIGPIYTHGAVEKGTQAYRDSGVTLPATRYVGTLDRKHDFTGGIVVAVPSAHATPWMRRFKNAATAMASGWMMVRGARRRRSVDRGFVLSDHVDWPELLRAIDACDPQQVWVTHGYAAAVARYLNENGRTARALRSQWVRSEDQEDAPEAGSDHRSEDPA